MTTQKPACGAAPGQARRAGSTVTSQAAMATTSPTGPGGYDRDLEVDERLHAEDLTEDPRLDSEAVCLCAVLWSTPDAARVVLEHLVAEDLDRPAHRGRVAIIAEQLQHSRPHDPASIAAVLTRQGPATTATCWRRPSLMPLRPAPHQSPPGTTPSTWSAPATDAASTPPPPGSRRPPPSFPMTTCSRTWLPSAGRSASRPNGCSASPPPSTLPAPSERRGECVEQLPAETDRDVRMINYPPLSSFHPAKVETVRFPLNVRGP